MESLFKKTNLLFLIAIRHQSEEELPTGNYMRDYSLFLKIAHLNKRIAMYEKCKRAVSEIIICTSECSINFEAHDLSLYPGDKVYFLNGRVHAENQPATPILHDRYRPTRPPAEIRANPSALPYSVSAILR